MLRSLLVSMAVLLAVPALAGELNGVKMEDSITVDGKALKLNGMGQRKKVVFKVYVAGLYLENPTSDANKIIAADETRRVDMSMQRNLEKEKITEAIRDGIAKNSKDKAAALEERLKKLTAAVPDLKEGQVLSITYVPGKGTTLKGGTAGEVTVEGKDFADALFQVWLGQSPVDDGLKKGMLGEK